MLKIFNAPSIPAAGPSLLGSLNHKIGKVYHALFQHFLQHFEFQDPMPILQVNSLVMLFVGECPQYVVQMAHLSPAAQCKKLKS